MRIVLLGEQATGKSSLLVALYGALVNHRAGEVRIARTVDDVEFLSNGLEAFGRRESAWRTELMVPRRAYNAELTTCSRLAAMMASFSIRSPNTAKDTFSPVMAAISRVRIAGKGGSSASASSAFCFRDGDADAACGLVWGTTSCLSDQFSKNPNPDYSQPG